MEKHKILERVNWTKSGASFTEWDNRGIKHGFLGRGAIAPSAYYPQQVHGTIICQASADTSWKHNEHRTEGDAIFAKEGGTKVAVRTADCLPLIFYSPKGVMAIHAGWRGLFAGILAKAVAYFQERGVATSELLIGIGPSIGFSQYEVGPEVMISLNQACLQLDYVDLALGISKGISDRWYLDLAMLGLLDLVNRGALPENITIMRHCTFNDQAAWHSYRRDKARSGRNWTWIAAS